MVTVLYKSRELHGRTLLVNIAGESWKSAAMLALFALSSDASYSLGFTLFVNEWGTRTYSFSDLRNNYIYHRKLNK